MSRTLGAEIERQALDVAPVIVCDLEGRIQLWTDGMRLLTGYAAEAALGRIADELLDTRLDEHRTAIEAALGRDGAWRGEVSYRRRDGARVTVDNKVAILRDAAGKPRAVAGFCLDITETKRAETDSAVLASLVASSDDAIIGKTLEGVVTSWNKAAERIFGYAASEMIGRTLEPLFAPELLPEEAVILGRVGRGERIEHYETTRLCKDGREIEVSVSISPVRDAAGRTVGASKIARDITEQKRVRARLEELQSQLLHVSRLGDMSQMATGLAHELNQPLSAISNYISGAQKLLAKGDVARAAEGCARAAEQVARAGEVIRRLRDFVGRAETRRGVEALGLLIEESAALALLGAAGMGVRLETRLAPDAREAVVDRIQIQQVLVNLIRNAAEAMAGHGARALTISTARHGADAVEVAVADTGPGLPPEVRARLFQPFTTTKGDGMGVGLSLCRSIVETHGGRIWAEDAPGGGTVFRFTLPRSEAEAR